MAMTTTLALAVVRVMVGLLVAGHGAQKVAGAFGGPGMRTWTGHVAALGIAPAPLFAWCAAVAELIGGLALALGFFTPVAAALVTTVMLVAIAKAHWKKGPWAAKGGYELPLMFAVAAAAAGLADEATYSLDAVIGLAPTPALFVTTLAIAIVTVLAGFAIAAPLRVRQRQSA
ncbi:MAG TPA: DoxX family protein [Candidatus Limnocylindria bacterium]|nr:DoxX family protein [Candidatus Limnocylindria bacterium]